MQTREFIPIVIMMTQSDFPLSNRSLFGGAILTSVPSHWHDVSLIRQVPDFQEVFQSVDDAHGSSSHTQVFVVEILERQEHVTDQDSAKFFLHDLMESDESNVNRMESDIIYNQTWIVGQDPPSSVTESSSNSPEGKNIMPNLSVRATACSAIAWHADSTCTRNHNRSNGSNYFFIELCVLRLESFQTDLLLTFTTSIHGEEQKSTMIQSYQEGHSKLFCQILSTFSIVDYSLFSS